MAWIVRGAIGAVAACAILLSAFTYARCCPPTYNPSSKGAVWVWDIWHNDQGDIDWGNVEGDARAMHDAGIDWVRVVVSPRVNPDSFEKLLAISRRNGISLICCIANDWPDNRKGYFGRTEQRSTEACLAKFVGRFKKDVPV